jgi:hypothetical protein
MIGFVKLQRTDVTKELLGDPIALHLLTVIALRARWSDEPSLDGLTFGQAAIGDHDVYGLTRAQERCARERLARWGLVRFDASRRGTIATLLDSRVFSLCDEREGPKLSLRDDDQVRESRTSEKRVGADGNHSQHDSHQSLEVKPTITANETANEQPTSSQRTATNQKEKRVKTKEEGALSPSHASLSLDPEQRASIAAELGVSLEVADACVRAFADHKADFPNDPRSPEAILRWLRVFTPGRAALRRATAAHTTRVQHGDEPAGWREWSAREYPDAPGAPHTKTWAQLDPATRGFIRREMGTAA